MCCIHTHPLLPHVGPMAKGAKNRIGTLQEGEGQMGGTAYEEGTLSWPARSQTSGQVVLAVHLPVPQCSGSSSRHSHQPGLGPGWVETTGMSPLSCRNSLCHSHRGLTNEGDQEKTRPVLSREARTPSLPASAPATAQPQASVPTGGL